MPPVIAPQKQEARQGVEQKVQYPGFKLTDAIKVPAVWAIAIFLTLNTALFFSFPEDTALSKDLWSGAGSIDLALEDLNHLSQRPDVVLLGSSLMMFPFFAMDQEIAPGSYDIFHHHNSITLSKELKSKGFKAQSNDNSEPCIFSLSIFGQMVSDAYIYANEFLQNEHLPKYVIYGTAPRDFSDNDLPSPTSTFTFRRLVGLANFPKYADLYLPTMKDKFEFIVDHAFFLYGRRWHLQKEVDKAIAKTYNYLGITDKTASEAKSEKAGFMLSGSNEERWNSSEKEYQKRYRNISDKDLSVQNGFMSNFLALCKQRNIKVILVNMPLTKRNRDILPEQFYSQFRQNLNDLCNKNDAVYVDLGSSPEFTDNDFWDTAHLNHFGGHKLLKHVLPHIN